MIQLLYMDKIWYILVENKELGPFTKVQLGQHPDFTPDTLTRKEASAKWQEARYIAELQSLFEDKQTEEQTTPDKISNLPLEDGNSLVISADPPFFSFWLMVIIGLLIITFYLLTQNL